MGLKIRAVHLMSLWLHDSDTEPDLGGATEIKNENDQRKKVKSLQAESQRRHYWSFYFINLVQHLSMLRRR